MRYGGFCVPTWRRNSLQRNHFERIYTKIGVSNRIGASMYALRHGLIPSATA